MKNIKNILKTNEYIIIIILFIIISLILLLIPKLNNSFIMSDKLYISEILVNNTYTHMNDELEYSDYIEIYNGYKYKINLENYYLSDSEFKTNKWMFPEIIINPDEYLIVYASGLDKCNLETRVCHTNFKLNSDGETLTLTDKSNNIINKFTYPKMSNDVSYGYNGRIYTLLNNPTPKKKNVSKIKYQKLDNRDIYINEYMIYNQRYSYDVDGNYLDFIEIYNNTNKDIELNNIYLSDDIDDLTKYKLPNVNINKNDYLLVYLGDISSIKDNQITANFKLSGNDEYIIISNGKKIIDKVEIVELYDNISYGMKDNKWYYFTKPTPGLINNTKGHISLGGINERS